VQTIETDILILGAGGAGLFAALALFDAQDRLALRNESYLDY